MKSYIRLLICCFILGVGALPAYAQTRSIISNLANPAIGFNALFLGQVASDLAEPFGLQFQESELSLISTVDPYWTLTANLVFAPDEVSPEEVFVTNTSIENIQLKLGRMKGTFGKHGLLHTHAFPFIQAPVVMANTIGEEGFNDVGIEAAWLTPLPWFCELTLGAYQSIGMDDKHPLNFGSREHLNIPLLGHLKNQFDLDEETTMELGGSALIGRGVISTDPNDPNYNIADGLNHAAFGADLTFRNIPLRQSNKRGWILAGEYLMRGTFNSGVYNLEADGWYASFQYRWSQNCWTGVRVEESFNSFTDVLVDPLTGNPVPGHIQRASANIAWLPSEFSVIRAEYSIARANDGNGNEPLDHRFMVQFAYVIGFHPWHNY